MQTGQQGTQQQSGGSVAPLPQGQPAEMQATPSLVTTSQQVQGQLSQEQQQQQQQQQFQSPAEGDQHGDTIASAQQPQGGQIHHLPDSAFRRIKDEAAERGKVEALEELVKANGYNSMEEMQAALKGGGKKPTRRPVRRALARKPAAITSQTDSEGDGNGGGIDPEEFRQFQRDMRLMQKRLEKQSTANASLTHQVKTQSALNRRLKTERNAVEAEMLVREAAARIGVRDVDYAMRLMTRHLAGKSEEEMAKFSEEKFFDGLREQHSYLFGEVSRPATTGNGAGTAQGSPPHPGAAQQGAASGGQVDARKMSPEDYRKHLQSRGLSLGV